MKRFRIALLAVAAFAGIGTAVAVNAKAKVAGQIYYGVLGTDGKVRWSKTQPSPTSKLCLPFNKLACTITSTRPEAEVLALVDAFPIQFSILNNSGVKVYQPINK